MRGVLVIVAAVAVACAPPATSGGRASRDNNFITTEEIAASQTTNVYDAINNLRPMFLRSRGQTTFDPSVVQTAVVFVDGQKFGSVETLKTMPVLQVTSIRFLTPSDATTKYGTGYMAGIIEVSMR
jgi:hypothetical protein